MTDSGDIGGLVMQAGRMIDNCLNLHEVAENCRLVRDAVHMALDAGTVPLLKGGDHSLAIGSIAAAARHAAATSRPLHVLWLDAHADFNTPVSSPSGLIYGMPVAVAMGEGHALLTSIGRAAPRLDPANITMVGVRSIDPLEAVRIREHGLRVHAMADIRAHGMAALIEPMIDDVRRSGGHLHVSFDVDFLDPGVAPGVGLPEPNGPSFDEAAACFAAIGASGLLGSLDLVELSPPQDPSGGTARRVVDLVARAFR